MRANITDLIKIQKEVNTKVNEKLGDQPNGDDYLLAFNVELFEFLNAVGTWKWWKHSHVIDRKKILDELADCFAFFLSVVDYENELSIFNNEREIIEDVESDINSILESLENFQKESDSDVNSVINDLSKYIGTDNEIEPILTIERFAIAIFITSILFENITWEELTEAYREKSKINIQRQVENY